MEQQKVYLKSIEEISDALAAGKVVYNKYEIKIWKDKNGFIVSERKDGSKFLNDYMFHPDDEPYILEPKPLEVKLWHLYETLGKEKILIVEREKNPVNFFEFVGCVVDKGFDKYKFDKNGVSNLIVVDNIVKELADLSQYFEKEPKNEKND